MAALDMSQMAVMRHDWVAEEIAYHGFSNFDDMPDNDQEAAQRAEVDALKTAADAAERNPQNYSQSALAASLGSADVILRAISLRYEKKARLERQGRIRHHNRIFKGLVRAIVILRRMRLRAAKAVYAPGGTGYAAAAESFGSSVLEANGNASG